ncbi:MAG: redoxin domain-containing protein, partial [Pseudomonadota bacterium]
MSATSESVPTPLSEEIQAADLIGARFIDLDGQIVRIGMDGETIPVIIVFIGDKCPVSQRYAPELKQFADRAESAGLKFYGVISDPYVSAEEARKIALEYGLDFTVLWDASGDLAQRLSPEVTPEAFVISPQGAVLYRGRIDNRFASVGVLRNQITQHDLSDVIAALGSGKELSPRRTDAVGCFFESWNESIPDAVTYNRDIAPIINANCVECHRAGSVAPFPLETHEQVRRRAKMIAFVTEQGIMPPWPAAKGRGHFRDERHLNQRQLELLSAWADQGAPLGDNDQAMPSPRWPSPDWINGEPDLVIEMDQAFRISADGPDIYRYFVVPVEVARDQHIIGLEFRPGDPKAVHHSLVYIDYTGRARSKDAEDDEYGFSVFNTGGFISASNPRNAVYLGGWTPGIDPLKLPSGHGIPLPGRSGDAVFEIHYRPTGKETFDQSRIGLYFAKEPIKHTVASTVAGTIDVDIDPEDDNYWRQVY